jgi:hypothetical protein
VSHRPVDPPVLVAPARAPAVLDGAEVLLATFEQSGTRGDDLLPSGLTPTHPTLVTFLVLHAPSSPWGRFSVAQVRLSCRSGARARALAVGQAVDASDEAASALAAGWGIGGARCSVRLDRRYDAVQATCDGFDVTVLDPAPIGLHDVQHVVGLHPVTTRAGDVRLAQVELDVDALRVERGRPALRAFAPDVWGEPRLRPTHPVTASVSVGVVTLPALRFLIDPAVQPHLGTSRA